MIIDNAGTYTLRYTATDECGNSTTVDRELVVEEPIHIYGASWDGSSSPVWTRTDESADFADPSPAVNNGTGSSPFDGLMPWSGMQIVEDAEAGTLVSIPKYYYKWTRFGNNNAGMKLQIADKPVEGFLVSPAHADRGDGVGERDVVYVGRYHCARDTMKSETSKMPKVSQSISEARESISNLGSSVWQYDFAMFWTIAMLYLVEFANWNSQAVIGYGCTGTPYTIEQSGLTDQMQYHTGTNVVTKDTYGQVQYRYIEGLWSDVWDKCDGIYFSDSNGEESSINTAINIVKNPSDFGTHNDRVVITYDRATNSGNSIRSFLSPSLTGYEYALFPSIVSNTGNTYICDEYYTNADYTNLSLGGGRTQTQTAGLFDFYCGKGLKEQIIGSRLMKLPSA